MYLQANLMAVVPNKTNSTAYFYCTKKKCVLPVTLSGETSFSLIVCQQKLLYDCVSNYPCDMEIKEGINSMVISAEAVFDELLLDKHGIKVTKELIKKSLVL